MSAGSRAICERQGFAGSLFMMGSNGGAALGRAHLPRSRSALVESGPIGGCIGAGAYAEALGFANVIAFDMGGTTAKCALVENGRFSVDSVYYAGGYVKGFPIKSPVIDIVEVGSGGGSIAWLDPQNRLHVGPQSAGSTPGPACYGNGGTEPTVTDANLVLGRLNPDRFLGGELKLDVARRARAPSSGSPRRSAMPASDGIDPDGRRHPRARHRDHGRRHQADLDRARPRSARIRAVLLWRRRAAARQRAGARAVDPDRGHSARARQFLGRRHAAGRCAARPVARPSSACSTSTIVAPLDDAFAEMEARSARRAARANSAPARCCSSAMPRCAIAGQRHNIKVPISGARRCRRASAQAFDRDYKRRYGHADSQGAGRAPGAAPLGLHAAAAARAARLPRAQATARAAEHAAGLFRRRAAAWSDAQIYERTALAPGFKGDGPALIEEYGSTTLVWPGDRFEIGELGEIRIDCGGAER